MSTAERAVLSIASTIDVRFHNVSPTEIDRAWNEASRKFSYPNPDYVKAERRNDPRIHVHAPRLTDCRRLDAETIRFPRGGRRAIEALFASRRIPFEYRDNRNRAPFTFPPCAIELRPEQQAAVEACRRRAQCLLLAPTGAGKTVMLSALAGATGQRTLILAPTCDIAEQIADTVERSFGFRPVMLARETLGSVDTAPVAVSTYALLTRLTAAERGALYTRFGCLIVDEAHHAAAGKLFDAVDEFPGPYRFGVTATKVRPDGLEVREAHIFGPDDVCLERAPLVALGRLCNATYVAVPSAFRFGWRGPEDWPRVQDALEVNQERNALIVDTAVKASRERTTLVLVGRVAHAEALAEACRAAGVRAQAVHGQLNKRQRAAVLADARAGAIDVLVGTSVADEGLDIPRLACVVFAWSGRAAGRVIQRIGRILRPCEGKREPVIVDIVDGHVPPLKRHASLRRQTIERELGAQTRLAS